MREERPMARRDSPLTSAQLDLLRSRLEEERTRILRVLRTAPDLPGAIPEEEQSEFEEVAQRTAERSDELGVSIRERTLLAEVDQALDRLRAGTYGVDEETGEPIPYERLRAVPWARGGVEE
jgi:DnaK suppressor protein